MGAASSASTVTATTDPAMTMALERGTAAARRRQQDDRQQEPGLHRPQRGQLDAEERRRQRRQHEHPGQQHDQHAPIGIRRPKRLGEQAPHRDARPAHRPRSAVRHSRSRPADRFATLVRTSPGDECAVRHVDVVERRERGHRQPVEMRRQHEQSYDCRNPWRQRPQIGPARRVCQRGDDERRNQIDREVLAEHGEARGGAGGGRPRDPAVWNARRKQ